jgi:hypothetical protein
LKWGKARRDCPQLPCACEGYPVKHNEKGGHY